VATLTGTHAEFGSEPQQSRGAAPHAVFPFVVVSLSPAGAATVARIATPGVAWAAYYAAIQAYPDTVVSLQRDGRRLAYSRP
jgi:hypothetical protein